MNSMLRIANDPITWSVAAADADALWRTGELPDHAVSIPVTAPLAGSLILAPAAVGAVALVAAPVDQGGWSPSDVDAPAARIYVPGTGVADDDQLGYRLAPGTDVDALTAQVTTALTEGSLLHVEVAGALGAGHLVLNGAALGHVVISRGRD